MKYANHNNMNVPKFEYDELENSIVDSLSEISIASNLPITIHNQTYLNNTISEVVSLYLWSTDFSSRRNNDLINKNRKSKTGIDFDKLTWYTEGISTPTPSDSKNSRLSVYEDNRDDHKKNQSPKTAQSKRLTSGADTKNSNKLLIPSLDLSYLQDARKSNEFTGEHVVQIKTDPDKKPSGKHVVATKETNKNVQNQSKFKDEIEFLLRELKLNKYQSSDVNDYYDHDFETKFTKLDDYEKLNTMAANLKDLLGRLLEKRKAAKRNMTVDRMSREEVHSEKIDTQKELLTFEEKHGRPQTKLEKDLMRPLYDHYRKVKRLIAKPGVKTPGSHESHEEVDEEDLNHLKDNKHFVNLHSLSLGELIKERDQSLLDKTKLKEVIKKYEMEFTKQSGRPLSKEDREFHKEDFERYKILKAKLKFLDVLIEKSESASKR